MHICCFFVLVSWSFDNIIKDTRSCYVSFMEELLLMTGGNKVKEEEATVVCRFASANYYYYKLVSCVIQRDCPLPDLLPRWLPVCTQHLPICQYRALPKVQFVGNPRDGPKRLFTSFSIATAGWSSAYVHQQWPTTTSSFNHQWVAIVVISIYVSSLD